MVYTVEPRLVLTMRLHLYDDSNLTKSPKTALHEILADPKRREEDIAGYRDLAASHIVTTGRTSTRPTSDFTRPGAWSEKMVMGMSGSTCKRA